MTDYLTFTPAKVHARRPDKTLTISGYTITKLYRHWKVLDPQGELVCITVYKCGAKEVVRRLLGSVKGNDPGS